MSDPTTTTNPRSSSSSSSEKGIQQVLEAEANRQRAALGASMRPPAFGRASSGSLLGSPSLGRASSGRAPPMSSLLPPSLRASQSLDLAASMPPSLRPSQSLDLTSPSLRAAQSLDLGPPSLGRATSLELAAARRAAALNVAAYPSTVGSAAMMYDPRRRFLMAQQTMPPQAFSGGPHMFGAGASSAAMMGAGPWMNMPNEGLRPPGLELLRAASISLPNRIGAGFPPLGAGSAAAAAASMGVPPGMSAAMAANTMPGFSPEVTAGATAGGKRKSRDPGHSSDDEEGSDKVFIPDIRDLDILCGRGGKSNHHFGNKRYRQVVSEMKMMYRKTEAKTVKTDLSRAIVDHVCSYGGRFVKKDSATGRYYLLTKAEARKKTSQALRETKALKWTM